jgi:hypothetical protein
MGAALHVAEAVAEPQREESEHCYILGAVGTAGCLIYRVPILLLLQER